VVHVEVTPSRSGDSPSVEAFLRAHHSLRVARRGELVDSLDHPSLLAWDGDDLVGVATYVIGDGDCELLTLHATARLNGVGTALLAAVQDVAGRAGCTHLWVLTTNDNIDALRFYQRRGFRLSTLRPGAVDESRRTLKPEIGTTGEYGIPLRDEIELEMPLPHAGSDDALTPSS
jgi:GNAT superfamily N-acetyltransferase